MKSRDDGCDEMMESLKSESVNLMFPMQEHDYPLAIMDVVLDKSYTDTSLY